MSEPVSGSRRHWQFDWRLMVFSGAFLPVLLSLAVWQLDRAEQKQAQLEQWSQSAENLSWPEHNRQGLNVGQPVSLAGQYDDRSWLLDNRTRDGIPGYEVLTLFKPTEGPTLVVNRGWVSAPRRRENLPEITVPEGNVVISGRLSEFPQPPVLKQTANQNTGWPRRVQSLTHEQAAGLAPAVVSFTLKLDGQDQPGGYRADWVPDRMGPQTHYGYAAQWFSLAVALVILTVAASYRSEPRKTGANNDNDNG